MRVFTLGSGFVAEHLPYQKITERFSMSEFNIKTILDMYKPDVLINCMGRTGSPNIDSCENEKEKTALGNVALPLLIADYCKKNNVFLISLASGCVFYGESPNIRCERCEEHPDNCICYTDESGEKYHHTRTIDSGWKETDISDPLSFYSRTKYSADMILGQLDSTTCLRLRMPISDRNYPRNLITKLKNYKQVINIPNSVTFVDDLVKCIDWAVKERPNGIFHVTNQQPLTADRIMQEYQKYVPSHQFEIITENQLDKITIAKRSNCILSTQKLNDAGFYMSDSEEALERTMKAYCANLKG